MKKNEIDFKADNIQLYGNLFIPDIGAGPHAAVCICHGIPGAANKPDGGGYAVLAEQFCSAGFVTLIFNFRGTGRSQGNFDILSWSRDLKAAVDFLHMRNDVDKSKLSLVGFSGGAAISIYIAANDLRVSSVVSLACPADFIFPEEHPREDIVNHFREIGIIRDNNFPSSLDEWFESFDIVSPVNWIANISPRPLYLIHGDKDDLVSVEHAYRLFKQAKEPKAISIISGAGHQLRLEERAANAALSWLIKTNS